MSILVLSNPSIYDIRIVPKHITKLQIVGGLSIECMKEINKFEWIDRLDVFNMIISINVAIELSKSKTIKELWCDQGCINRDCMKELLKSKSIITFYNANYSHFPWGMERSIVIKKRYYFFIETTTVLNLISSFTTIIGTQYNTNTKHNANNWKQKYGIL